MEQKLIAKMTGYKATDKNMCCKGFQFEIGKEYEIDKNLPLEVCRQGFHFCQQPSGVWSYYSDSDTRLFKVEAFDVLDTPFEAGADFKRVCRKIKFVEEIKIGGDRNTGYRNTGHSNTGYSNTGDRNTGYRNTGDSNTGDWNTGDRNTGDSNTGDRNTGDRNTGHSNTGDRNTGHSNTGYRNTGDWNLTNYSSGYFCVKEPPVIIFDKPAKIKRDNLPLCLMQSLYEKLMQDEDFDITPYLKIPNATIAKIKAMHKKYISLRKSRQKAE
jgi:hypothetical protein